MATKKLSEALAELQAAASVSGLDVRLVVAGQTDTDNAQTITLQQLLTALNVPTAQSGTQGTSNNYIYSASSDEMHTSLSGKVWIYQYGCNQYLRFKHWGASNDTEGTNMSQVMLPTVSYSGRGLMDNTLYRRINNHTLTTANSADAVVINYTNFDTGGNKTLTIERASSAKAGVMTAQDKTNLDKLTEQLNNKDNGNNDKIKITDDNSFSVCDSDGNVVLRYNNEGLDAAKVTRHLAELISALLKTNDATSLLVQRETKENGLYFVDNERNIGLCIDSTGLHTINTIEYINE